MLTLLRSLSAVTLTPTPKSQLLQCLCPTFNCMLPPTINRTISISRRFWIRSWPCVMYKRGTMTMTTQICTSTNCTNTNCRKTENKGSYNLQRLPEIEYK
ncbi:hypothetical protein VNO77_35537 [Canavalia gladiata]|uniref:Uncharacterized protein n=1 Tax=Canavalia gladiata TaxID=3824 RepID=A0AAN9KHN4_CANGL